MRSSGVLLLALVTTFAVAACGVAEFDVFPADGTPTPTATETPSITPVPTSTVIASDVQYDGCVPILRSSPILGEMDLLGPFGIAPGTAVLLHQTQDLLDGLEEAGRYELGVVATVTSASAAEVHVSLLVPYFAHEFESNGTDTRAQLCVVPYFDTLTIADAAAFHAAPWDGAKGGILPLRANTIDFENGVIRVAGTGFVGGTFGISGGGTGEGLQTALASPTPTPNLGGVGGTNGCGGGGGGAVGSGGLGGGTFGGDGGKVRPMEVGYAHFGGGGGGGDQDAGSLSAFGTGGRGGGFLFIAADSIVADPLDAGIIDADGGPGGSPVEASATTAGAGGGGGGGTIVLRSLVSSTGGIPNCTTTIPLEILARGGSGGSGTVTALRGGGGGGGGAIFGVCDTGGSPVFPEYRAKGGLGGDGTGIEDGAAGEPTD